MAMARNLEQQADDLPFGFIGRLLGLRVISPESAGDEHLEWAARANMMQQRIRAVGGRLYLTDRRLVFGRTRIEARSGGKEWSAALPDLASASAVGWRKIEVDRVDGRAFRFVVSSPEDAAETIDRAIRGARPVDEGSPMS